MLLGVLSQAAGLCSAEDNSRKDSPPCFLYALYQIRYESPATKRECTGGFSQDSGRAPPAACWAVRSTPVRARRVLRLLVLAALRAFDHAMGRAAAD